MTKTMERAYEKKDVGMDKRMGVKEDSRKDKRMDSIAMHAAIANKYLVKKPG